MKSFLTGLVAILTIGAIFFAVRNQGLVPTADPTPTPTSIPSNWDMQPNTSPDPTPTSTTSAQGESASGRKGGLVLGDTTKPVTSVTTTTTTTTKKTTSITILESSDCLLDATSFVRDLTSPLTIQYDLADNYSATVTIWKESGESVLPQTLISGKGVLTTIDSLDNLKFQIVSKDCTEISDTWLSITATQ